ncbi:MAG: glycosyltransferase N-terminal domain-containing protein [Ferruginibacter sp.]
MLLYNAFLRLYSIGIKMISLWNPKARRWVEGRKDLFIKLNHFRLKTTNKKKVWVHCASLGEYEQGLPVLEKIKAAYPDYIMVLSFFSPSGYEAVKNRNSADEIFYLPMDNALNAKRFLDAIEPSLVIWIKYEYWYYYLTELKQRNIPVLLVSGIFRKSQPFFKWYGNVWKKMLGCFDHLFVQSQESATLLSGIDISGNISVSGDTRFDRVIEIAETAGPDLPAHIAEFCAGSKIIVAGSTWPEDEEELDHYANKHREIKFIIAPHEIDDAHLKEIEKLFHHTLRYSAFDINRDMGANVLIIDNIGLLSRLYKCADITYVGGGFGADGIHNVLEPAVYGKPVVFGPEYEKYLEAEELLETGGGISIDNALELEMLLDELIMDENKLMEAGTASKKYVYSRAGASQQILDYIQVKRLLIS